MVHNSGDIAKVERPLLEHERYREIVPLSQCDLSTAKSFLERMFENKSDIEKDFKKTETQEKDEISDVADVPQELTDEEKRAKIDQFLSGEIGFDEVKEIFAEYYADAVNSNHPWSWNEDIPGGDELTGNQKKTIKELAVELGYIPKVPTYEVDGKTYADFSEYSAFECKLDEEYYDKTDPEQFKECTKQLQEAIEKNPELAKQFTPEQLEQIKNGEANITGYTWHHTEKDGIMQLIPYGIHNATYHNGGRSEGNWADAPRH